MEIDNEVIEYKRRVAKIRRVNALKNLKSIFIQLIAHISAVVTIFSLRFINNNEITIDFSSWIDWLLLALCLFILFYGGFIVTKELKGSNVLVVNRKELHDLLTVARLEAKKSIISFGGDLSWLCEDIDDLKQMHLKNKELKIKIYYDQISIDENTLNIIKDIKKTTEIQVKPYNTKVAPSIRCMITDAELEDKSSKVFIYPKKNIVETGKKEKEMFVWQEYNADDKIIYGSIMSLLNEIDSVKRRSVKVGICGINNVGKTTLANKIYRLLEERGYNCKVYDDVFKLSEGSKNEKITLSRNLLFLIKQMDQENECDADICIYDRTLLDNFLYLCNREEESTFKRSDNKLLVGKLKDTMYSKILKSMKRFDLVVWVNRSHESHDKQGSKTSPEIRKKVDEGFEEFFQNNLDIKKEKVFIDFKKSKKPNGEDLIVEKSIQENAMEITDIIERIILKGDYD